MAGGSDKTSPGARERENREALTTLAIEQGGIFTAQQAAEIGYAPSNHARMVKSGQWERLARGLYRLQSVPAADRADLIAVTLWSRGTSGDPLGVVSHASALALWDLSDISPSGMIDLTVPPGFQHRSTPPYPVRLHRLKHGRLDMAEIEERPGYLLTRPLRSILDLLQEGKTDPRQLYEAARRGVAEGLIVKADLERQTVSDGERQIIMSWLAG